jgi:diaminobutyrate-2-oxoglutarate transaminase
MASVAKRNFLQKFLDTILMPRNLNYKIQFTGPTGTCAIESALKLARRIKKRSNIVAFTKGYHGLTMGSLGVTANGFYRDEFTGQAANTAFMPFDGYLGNSIDTIDVFRNYLDDPSSGIDLPAAVIVETVQGEGGINVAGIEWLRRLESLCRSFDILLIIDDIQMGNGPMGPFFSFEHAGLKPDMVTLSKSLGGGLPLSILLMRSDLDQWRPGEDTSTFRGNSLALVAATEVLGYWEDDVLSEMVLASGETIGRALRAIANEYGNLGIEVRGRGMAWGLDLKKSENGSRV